MKREMSSMHVNNEAIHSHLEPIALGVQTFNLYGRINACLFSSSNPVIERRVDSVSVIDSYIILRGIIPPLESADDFSSSDALRGVRSPRGSPIGAIDSDQLIDF